MSLLLTAQTAQAASPHFKKGGTPVCYVSYPSATSASVYCTGTLSGLGNEDVTITVTPNGYASYTCRNQGGNEAPGQNKVPATSSPSRTVYPAGEIKNGNLTFNTSDQPSTLTAPSATWQTAGCPNSNWSAVAKSVTVTSVSLLIEQGNTVIYSCTQPVTGSTVRFPADSC